MTGTILKKSLARFGIRPNPKKCRCNGHAEIMDSRGPEWCERNKEIIVHWMKAEAVKLGLPFSQTFARYLIDRSIRKAKNIRDK